MKFWIQGDANLHKSLARVALTALLVLIVPLVLMVFRIPVYDPGSGYEVINWSIYDFVTMGLLFFTIGSILTVIHRTMKNRLNMLLISVLVILGFLWLWAELAVGVFTNWGN